MQTAARRQSTAAGWRVSFNRRQSSAVRQWRASSEPLGRHQAAISRQQSDRQRSGSQTGSFQSIGSPLESLAVLVRPRSVVCKAEGSMPQSSAVHGSHRQSTSAVGSPRESSSGLGSPHQSSSGLVRPRQSSAGSGGQRQSSAVSGSQGQPSAVNR